MFGKRSKAAWREGEKTGKTTFRPLSATTTDEFFVLIEAYGEWARFRSDSIKLELVFGSEMGAFTLERRSSRR